MGTYRPNSAASTTIDEGELVLPHLDRQQCCSLNETSGRTRQPFPEGHAVDVTVTAIGEEWAISEAKAQRNIRSFLQESGNAGMVATSPDATP